MTKLSQSIKSLYNSIVAKIMYRWLRKQFSKKLARYQVLASNYDCGSSVMHYICPETSILYNDLASMLQTIKEFEAYINIPIEQRIKL